MLELLVSIGLVRLLSRLAARRGRSRLWAVLGVALLLGGEGLGFVLGGELGLSFAASYGLALPLGAAGAAAAYFTVLELAPSRSTDVRSPEEVL